MPARDTRRPAPPKRPPSNPPRHSAPGPRTAAAWRRRHHRCWSTTAPAPPCPDPPPPSSGVGRRGHRGAALLMFLAVTLLAVGGAWEAAAAASSEIFQEGKSDKEILDDLLRSTRYDKRLLPPVTDADQCCETGRSRASSPPTPSSYPHSFVYSNFRDTSTGKSRRRFGESTGTLTVNMSVLLLSLASPDESSLKYEVEFLLQQQWFDPRLKYSNASRYEYLNAIHHHEDVWLPDTYFIMHGDFKDPLIPVHFALRIYRNGTVNYLMRRHLILSCQGSLNIFPFDDPLCSFAMESISYEQTAVTYVWKNDEDTLRKSPSLTTLNAYLIRNQTVACSTKSSWREGDYSIAQDELEGGKEEDEYEGGVGDIGGGEAKEWRDYQEGGKCSLCQRRFEEQGNYSCLKVDLIFTRDRAFYFTTVFIPGIILVTSSFITFWLEWNAVPARVMIGVTTMLNFFTTSNGFRSTLPVVSNLTAMNVWDGVCMCFIYASLLEFVAVNYVGRKRPHHNVVYRPGENPVTQRLPAVLSRIGIILASPLVRQGDKKRESSGPNEIVSCTNCGPNPCTHTANNGCATEVEVLQNTALVAVQAEVQLGDGAQGATEGISEVAGKELDRIAGEASAATGGGSVAGVKNGEDVVRKKERPHPIRVAKTIDVIARIVFPVAYAIFLIFFFVHYKGFS